MAESHDAWAARAALDLFRDAQFQQELAKVDRAQMKLMARVAAQAECVEQVEILQRYQNARRGEGDRPLFPISVSSRVLDKAGRDAEAPARLAALYGQLARLHYTVVRK